MASIDNLTWFEIQHIVLNRFSIMAYPTILRFSWLPVWLKVYTIESTVINLLTKRRQTNKLNLQTAALIIMILLNIRSVNEKIKSVVDLLYSTLMSVSLQVQ